MANTSNENQDSNLIKEMSMDIVFGLLGKAGETLFSMPKQGLLNALKTVSKCNDPAARHCL